MGQDPSQAPHFLTSRWAPLSTSRGRTLVGGGSHRRDQYLRRIRDLFGQGESFPVVSSLQQQFGFGPTCYSFFLSQNDWRAERYGLPGEVCGNPLSCPMPERQGGREIDRPGLGLGILLSLLAGGRPRLGSACKSTAFRGELFESGK